ncbi:MAG: GntG family PLP-dependent aldolase [Saprospiraceae bacterium]
MLPINLISDTITLPTASMKAAMLEAALGDDVFGEDPTVNALQQKMARMFGIESAMFCPSGTMTNQIAIKVHTRPLDEVICDKDSHIYLYEVGGYAYHSGIAIQLIDGVNGVINAEQIKTQIKPIKDWLPRSKLVVLENTSNRGGGNYYEKGSIEPIKKLCQEKGMALHLDGARLFNAMTESGESPMDFGHLFDSISICLSKGLGAPVGSVLLGTKSFIDEARRVRKVMGGGMRQAGILAAAGIYALDNNVLRLKEDHIHAREIGIALSKCTWVDAILPVKTNIVIFGVDPEIGAETILHKLENAGIKASGFGGNNIRMVTHLDFSPEHMSEFMRILPKIA